MRKQTVPPPPLGSSHSTGQKGGLLQVRANPSFGQTVSLVPGPGAQAQEQWAGSGDRSVQWGHHPRWAPRSRVEAGTLSSAVPFQGPSAPPGQCEQQASMCSSAVSWEVEGKKHLQRWQKREWRWHLWLSLLQGGPWVEKGTQEALEK